MSMKTSHKMATESHRKEVKISHNTDFNAKDLMIAGCLTGLFLEFANFIRREERYKTILSFMCDFPGISFAIFSLLLGTTLIYGNIFQRFFKKEVIPE